VLHRCGVRSRGGRQVHRAGVFARRSRLRRVADRTDRPVPAGVRERTSAELQLHVGGDGGGVHSDDDHRHDHDHVNE